MPITTKHGSIFDSTASVLVCPVNCVGVMGKGLALEFKRRWPYHSNEYMDYCQDGLMAPGRLFLYSPIWFAATKLHWRDPSKHCWIGNCLASIAEFPPASIAIPQLGCGCGGLDWADVWPMYEQHLGALDCDVEVWIHE